MGQLDLEFARWCCAVVYPLLLWIASTLYTWLWRTGWREKNLKVPARVRRNWLTRRFLVFLRDERQGDIAIVVTAFAMWLGFVSVSRAASLDFAVSWIATYLAISITLFLLSVLRTTRWYRAHYCNWFWCRDRSSGDFRFEEELTDVPDRSRGPVLATLEATTALFRRTMPFEHWKHLTSLPLTYRTESQNTPAWSIDIYQLWWLPVLIVAAEIPIRIVDEWQPFFTLFGIWILVEIIQSTFFHQVYRAAIPAQTSKAVHSGVRSIALTVLDYFKVVWVFGLIYWWSFGAEGFGAQRGIATVYSCIYFSIVTAATVGFGDIAPLSDHLDVQIAVACEIAVTLMLTVVVLARVVNVVGKMDDYATQHRRDSTYGT